MSLKASEQWIVQYLTRQIPHWEDVSHEAERELRKVESGQDLKAWVGFFLPKKRWQATLTALNNAKSQQGKPAPQGAQVSVPMAEDVARRLVREAKAQRCSVSDLVSQFLAHQPDYS